MKLNYKLSIVAALFISTLQAGIPGIDIGAGVGQTSSSAPTGKYSDTFGNQIDLQDTLGLDGGNNTYAWAYFEHAIPVIPNFRLELNNDKYTGNVDLNRSFLGKNFNSNVNTTLDLSSQDLITYWSVPLTGLMSTITPMLSYDLNFGLGVKQFNGSAIVEEATTGIATTQDINEFLPYGYLRGRVETFGFGLEGQVKYAEYDVNKYVDTVIKVDYALSIIPTIDLGIEAGYKTTNLVVDLDTITSDLSTSGYFFGVFTKF